MNSNLFLLHTSFISFYIPRSKNWDHALSSIEAERNGEDDSLRGVAQDGGGMEGVGQFVLETEIASDGATDWEHFVVGGVDYLALANEGDVRNSLHQLSPIFRLVVQCSPPADKPEL